MARSRLLLALIMALALPAWGHDIITTRITWAREISRIFQHRCASCHRAGGAAPMPLLSYDEVRPWARSIAEEVLERRMPPWNPVKGFGDFRHEAGLNQEEIGLIAEWVEGGAPRGEDRYLPPAFVPAPAAKARQGPVLPLTHQLALPRSVVALGIAVSRLAEGGSLRVWAELPDGGTEPLLEIAQFRAVANHPYEFRRPLTLPAGTKLHLEGAAAVSLIRSPLSSGGLPARRSVPSAPRPTAAPAATPDARRAAERLH